MKSFDHWLIEKGQPILWVLGVASYAIWLGSVAYGGGWLDASGKPVGPDHLAFHAAAQLIREGQGAHLYDYPEVTLIRNRQRELTGLDDFLNPYRNPPFAAWPYQFTSQLAYPVSFAIWAALGLVGLAVSVALIVPRSHYGQALSLSLCFYPTFATIAFGQNSFLSLTIISIACACYLRGLATASGLVMGLLLYKPQLLLGFAVWAILDFKKLQNVWLGFLVTAGILIAVSGAMFPQESRAWLENWEGIVRYDAFDYFNLTNATGFFSLLFGDNRALGKACGLLVLLLGLVVFVQFWRKHRQNPTLLFAGSVYFGLLISPHTMVYEWSLALLSVWLLWYRTKMDKTLLRRGLVFLVVGLLAGPPISRIMLTQLGFALQFGWLGALVAAIHFYYGWPRTLKETID